MRSLETASEELSHIPVPPNSHFPGLKEHNQLIEVKEVLPPGQVQKQRVTRSNQMDLTSATFPPQCLAITNGVLKNPEAASSNWQRKYVDSNDHKFSREVDLQFHLFSQALPHIHLR